MSGSKNKPLRDGFSAYVELVRIQESERTKRVTVLGVVGIVGLAMICWTIVKASESPPWVQALAIVAGAVPSSVFMWRMRVRFKSYMKTGNARLRSLEVEFDAKRTSSGINEDGSTPDGT